MFRTKNSVLIWIGIVVVVISAVGEVGAQSDALNLTKIQNGFRGIFKSGDQTLTVDSFDSPVAIKITNSEGNVLVEALSTKNLMTVTISGVVFKFPTDKESIEAKRFEKLSQGDDERFNAFRVSEESSVLRRMIVQIIKQRAVGDPGSLKGILIISLVLGDGPGFPPEVGNQGVKNVKCRAPKSLQIFALYSSPSIPIAKISKGKANTFECNESNCCGCCGLGCGGCTGCYTGACYAHDTCADQNGHVFCLALIPAAIA